MGGRLPFNFATADHLPSPREDRRAGAGGCGDKPSMGGGGRKKGKLRQPPFLPPPPPRPAQEVAGGTGEPAELRGYTIADHSQGSDASPEMWAHSLL